MIVLKSPQDIEKMRRSGAVVAEVLERLKEVVCPGVTTNDLDRIAEEHIRKAGGIPTFIGYQGYPKTLCTSVNEEVVHGIPNTRQLNDGDVIGIDCGVTLDGFVADSAVTLIIGSVTDELAMLVQTTKEAMLAGIEQMILGNRVGDIGYAIQKIAETHGYGVVRDFVGHGVGQKMHEEPQVPNFGRPGTGPRLKVGMVLAIEPMFNLGTGDVKVLSDGWTVVTKDGKSSAHFEHTIALTESGTRILTTV